MDTVSPYAGQCYAASEALYHLLGGRAAGLTPRVLRLTEDWKELLGTEFDTHWYLEDRWGGFLDPTADQFAYPAWHPPYHQGRRCGFLTTQPSKKAQALIDLAEEVI